MITLFHRESQSVQRTAPSGMAVILWAVIALIWVGIAIANLRDHHSTLGWVQIFCAVLYTVLTALNAALWLRKRRVA